MSWQNFKETILRVANSPESIPDRNTVAKLYADAYDTAIKNGGDSRHTIPLKSGNVELMRQGFLSALEKGVTTQGPYDLVAQMGDGVKAYWDSAIMSKLPTPTDLPEGVVSNINVLDNKIIDKGKWLEPLKTPSSPTPENTTQPVKQNEKPKPADDYNLRKMLDEVGYAAIKKYEDEKGCVALISGKTGLAITDYKQVGCRGYNPGQDIQEQTIKERIKNVLGFDVWAKIPPVFRMQIYSFMYNADSKASGDLFRWIAGLLQAAKNETAQYRKSVRENKTIRDVEVSYLKTLTTTDFQKIYPTYLKVLDEMYKAISDAELQSVANKTKNSEKAAAIYLASAYNLTWKDRPSTIQEYYNSSLFGKKDKAPQEAGQTTDPSKQTVQEPTSNIPLQSGPIPPTNNTSLFVDYFIRTAINHLGTIKGTITMQSSYGAINGISVLNWTGYTVKGTVQTRQIISVGDFLEDANLLLKQLEAEGLVAIEEIGNGEDADEFGGDGESATFYTGLVTPAQKRALKIAGEKVHYIGNYSAVRLGGKTIKGPGFDTGKCARWTYNLAYQYVNALRNKETPNGASFAANGNANADRDNPKFAGYWRSLEILGYKITVNTTYSKETLLKVLKSTDFDVGDVVVYWGVDATKGLSSYDYGHTQFFTGGINQNYKKSAIGTKGESPNAGTYKDTWTASNWDSDAYNNYGTYMVYKLPAKGPATKWRYLLFKAPTQ
jgi:hypothetical protein